MSGFGGAGAFSDGKYNITNEFGGTLHEYIGKKKAMELMKYNLNLYVELDEKCPFPQWKSDLKNLK